MKIATVTKLKHGVWWEVMARKGWSQLDLSEALGVSYNTVNKWVNLNAYPKQLTEKQYWKICNLTGLTPEDIWPEGGRDYIGLLPKSIEAIHDVEPEQMQRLSAVSAGVLDGPQETAMKNEAKQRIDDAVFGDDSPLSEREKVVLEKRIYAGASLTEIAKEFSVTRTRVTQIYRGALEKLRHPGRTKLLLEAREALDGN